MKETCSYKVCLIILSVVDDAKPNAWVSECALYLWVCVTASLPLHALGALYPSIPCSWVRFLSQGFSLYACYLSRRVYVIFLCVCRQECNTALVRACWNELFILGLAQCAQIMSLSTILAAIVNHLQSSIQDGMFYWNIKPDSHTGD